MMNRLSHEVETLKQKILQKHLNKLKTSQSSSGTENERNKNLKSKLTSDGMCNYGKILNLKKK